MTVAQPEGYVMETQVLPMIGPIYESIMLIIMNHLCKSSFDVSVG